MMTRVADRDQRGQRVAHDRQLHPLKPLVRTRRQLERKLRHATPCRRALAEFPGNREHGENRHGKRAVLAVAPLDRFRQHVRLEAASLRAQPHFHLSDRGPLAFRDRGALRRVGCRHRQRGPHQRRRADVAQADGRVTPAAIRILMRFQPGDALADLLGMAARVGQHESPDRGRGGERAAGEVAFPMTGGRPLGKQTRCQRAQRLVDRYCDVCRWGKRCQRGTRRHDYSARALKASTPLPLSSRRGGYTFF